jgi:hypothetical protein
MAPSKNFEITGSMLTNMVAECFNDFFINVAKDIGSETAADKNHPSIIEINKNKKDIPNLEFKEISKEFVHKK